MCWIGSREAEDDKDQTRTWKVWETSAAEAETEGAGRGGIDFDGSP